MMNYDHRYSNDNRRGGGGGYPPHYTRGHRHHHRGGHQRGQDDGYIVSPQPLTPYPPSYPNSNNTGGSSSSQSLMGRSDTRLSAPNSYYSSQYGSSDYGTDYGCHEDDLIYYDDEDYDYYDGEDIYYDDPYYGEGYNNFGDSINPYQQQQQQNVVSSQQPSLEIQKNLKELTKASFHEVIFDCDIRFTPRQLLTKDESTGQLRLKNNGRLIFNLKNGRAKLDKHSNKEDFRADLPLGNNDLVKSVEIINLTSDYKQKMLLSFKTIPTFDKEGARDGVDYVTHTLPLAALKEEKSYNKLIFERPINNGVIDFANAFPGQNPDNMDKKISWYTDPLTNKITHGLISVNPKSPHPLVFFYNQDHPEGHDLNINGPGPGLSQLQAVLLSKEDIDKYSSIAKEKLKQRISLGDVTNGFSVELSVPVPSGVEPSKFYGFADARHAYPNISNVQKEKVKGTEQSYQSYYMNRPQHISFQVYMKYIKLDGKNKIDY